MEYHTGDFIASGAQQTNIELQASYQSKKECIEIGLAPGRIEIHIGDSSMKIVQTIAKESFTK